MTEYKRGSIWYIKRMDGSVPVGSEQYAGRPAVIVSNDMGNALSDTVEVVYLTSQPKTDLPTHAVIRSTQRVSTALCEQIYTVSKKRIGNFLAVASPEEMRRIDIALQVSLGLGSGTEPEEDTEVPYDPQKRDQPLYTLTLADDQPHPTQEDVIRLEAERDTYKELYGLLIRELLTTKTTADAE